MTKADLAAQYPTYLTVDESTFTLTLWKNLKPVKTYTVAVGQPAYPTPTGLYHDRGQAGRPGLERSQLAVGR